MYIAFYKDNKLGAKLIQWWTGSKFNHCEIWTGTELVGVPSKATQVRRMDQDYLNPKKWEVYKILNYKFNETLEKFFKETEGRKYDNKAIWLSNFFNRHKQDNSKYTCSEWCIELIDKHYNIIYPRWYSCFNPGDILEVLLDKGLAVKVELNKEGKIK